MFGIVAKLIFIIAFALSAKSYIPAVSTNDTQKALAGGLNVTDVSKLNVHWYSKGSYSENVSFELAGNGSTGISKGVLVHFSEEYVNNLTEPTSTPWIALVSCDKNATNMSHYEDIFTLARDKGAVAAVLYSLSSVACIINPEYADMLTFERLFDIFSTQSLTSAKLIEYQFGQISTQNDSIFYYDSKRLNDSQSDIVQSIKLDDAASPGYLYAVLQAYNATVSPQDPSTNGSPSSNSNPPNPGATSSSALAMVVLYSITGCVSALFIIVIVSGAIRALRHPERYGPRPHLGDNGPPPQSRARGLTRAIIDTFPLVKFGAPSGQAIDMQQMPHEKDIEYAQNESTTDFTHSRDGSFPAECSAAASGSASATVPDPKNTVRTSEFFLPIVRDHDPQDPSTPFRSYGEGPSGNDSTASLPHHDDIVPAQIGRETCPICIVDFEEGDDIRVLPCDGKHCFHQRCVDPWLLKLSSSCPICRHDFLALENMIAGNNSDAEIDEPETEPQSFQPQRLQNGRFSRYLRFARLRQRQRRPGGVRNSIRPNSFGPLVPL